MTAEDRLSDLFWALSHPYRRVILYYLREHETATLDTLTECVTGWAESAPGATAGARPADDERVRVQLHHAHLPMLADTGFLTYDADTGEVTRRDLLPPTESVLSAAATVDAGNGELDVDALVVSSGK